MKEIFTYLKYKIKTEKLMFVGWILFCWVLINWSKYGMYFAVFVALLNYKRKNKIINFEKTLPVNSKAKKTGNTIYTFIVIVCALIFNQIKNSNIILGITIAWCYLFLFKIYDEKYDLKKKLRIRVGK